VHSQPRTPTIPWLREVILPLRSGETPPGVLHPALGPSAQDRHGSVGVRPEEATKMIRGLEHPSYEERLRRVGAVQSGKEKAAGRPYSSLPVLKVSL